MKSQGSQPASGDVYVFTSADWPMWQAAQRRAATERYAARTPQTLEDRREALPRWPFGVLFSLAMLALWWRERR
jgi:hypothetical protein